MRKHLLYLMFTVAAMLAPLQARAGIPVIDVTAIAQLIQQISYWQQQITAMSNQLSQLQQTYQSMTGPRGMEGLLPMTNQQRNYLPPDYAELMSVVNGTSSGYAGLSGQVQAAMAANAVLTNGQMAALNPQMRQIVEQGRKSAAMVRTLTQAAYQNTSQRFGALQTLITAIGTAGDSKAIQDLQGRIASEQAMLTNEQTKLQMLYQVAQADQWQQQQRIRERSAADVGSVNTLSAVPY